MGWSGKKIKHNVKGRVERVCCSGCGAERTATRGGGGGVREDEGEERLMEREKSRKYCTL